ncbi:MAG: hypothetical protein VKK59_06960 [Vampirovibrionales bacterium]|nr:hypothetical protein [Vampirovibrionales bacterium]
MPDNSFTSRTSKMTFNQTKQPHHSSFRLRQSSVEAVRRRVNREQWAQALLQQTSLSVILLELVAVNRLQLNQGEPGLTPRQLGQLIKCLELNQQGSGETPYVRMILALGEYYPQQASGLIPRFIKRIRNKIFHSLAKQKHQLLKNNTQDIIRYRTLKMVSTTRVCS